MSRVIRLVLVLICLASPGVAEGPLRPPPHLLAFAIEAAQAGRWQDATRLAARDGRTAVDLIEWHRLRAGEGSVPEILTFLRQNPDWPGLRYLRKQSEGIMMAANRDQVLEFYKNTPAQTGLGVLSHARALTNTGQSAKAEKNVIAAWRSMDLTTAEHNAFITTYGPALAPHHAARLDMALWRGLRDVQEMLPLVTAGQRQRARARATIEKGVPKLDKWVAALSKPVRNDAHVAYAIFNRHIKNNETDQAIKLILRQSRAKDGLGDPGRWAGWRRAITRSQMRDGHHQLAYDLASVHQLTEGSNYADLEWLAGYLALTFLDQPELARDHFQRFSAAVDTPISLGRAGYWLGRAQDALGDPEAAQIAYERGAQYQTSFYGLLAAERADVPPDPKLAGAETFPPWRSADFTKSSVYQAALLVLAAGDLDMAERFFVHLSESQDRNGLGQMAHMLAELDQPHLQVMLGKAAAKRGIVIHAAYYALHPLADDPQPVPTELALAIARRESEFNLGVVSGAGAQGLMQLMPGTAKEVAKSLDLPHSRTLVLTDWRYNVQLGSEFLAGLRGRFNNNIVMVSAAYNAGPGRAFDWMDQFGDPRKGQVDMIDWIEHIPFRETRNYVMRVSESLPIYRARLGIDPLPVPFSVELAGRTKVRPKQRPVNEG